MKLRMAAALIPLLIMIAALAGAQPDAPAGAAEITLEGGFIGNVPFPHRLHQESLGDCTVCHQLYPQEKGVIGNLKASGTIKKQQVMNSQCIACHRKNQNTGDPAGPTTCNACHRKS